MSNPVRISHLPKVTPVTITWNSSNPHAAIIELMIFDRRMDWLVDTDDVPKAEVNGQPAALVGGTWDADTGKWNSGYDLTLSWMKGEEIYRLSAPGGTAEDLIRMAESIP